jgi:ferrochelatase
MSRYDAVLFIGFGGPEKREEIRPFLETVTRGRGIPPERIEEVAHHYEKIGGASPINTITNRQAAALQAALAKTDTPWPVYVGNRNWHPFLEDTLRQMASDGVKRAIGFVTAAYRCEASWERYLNAVEAARLRIGQSAPAIDYVGPWFDHPLFIEAIVARVREVLSASAKAPADTGQSLGEGGWIFTAHSIPIPMAEASRYVQELSKTAELVAQKFNQKEWHLAYTSRSGAPKDPWLEPDVCDEIKTQSQRGIREIIAIPIGFLADHVEVLFDLDVEALEAARLAGITLRRAQTVGDHPLFIQMIADVVRKITAAVPR